MAETSTRVAITVAVITAVGAVAAAAITSFGPGSGPQPPPTTPPSATAEAAGVEGTTEPAATVDNRLPSDFHGTWTGSLTLAGSTVPGQVGTTVIPFALQLGPGRPGEVVGTFSQTGCAGQVVFEGGTTTAEFTDQTTQSAGLCAPSARAQAVLSDSRTMTYILYDGTNVSGQGVLARN